MQMYITSVVRLRNAVVGQGRDVYAGNHRLFDFVHCNYARDACNPIPQRYFFNEVERVVEVTK